jgi:tetratricopeptide (TPR) repeat protein
VNQTGIGITARELLAIAHPEAEISAEQLKQLEQLVDRFPWFAYGQLLLLKGMMQRRRSSFDDRLLSASLYATSRERLHDYLKQIKTVDPNKQSLHPAADANLNNLSSSSDNDDGFEVMPFDTVCEKVVETPPTLPPLASRQGSAAYHDRLIDMFLATQPSAMKPRSGVSDGDLTQLSEKDTAPELVSETLAEIYLAQGLPDKAEQIYLKLSLLYPEKKAYFATRFQSQCAGVSS